MIDESAELREELRRYEGATLHLHDVLGVHPRETDQLAWRRGERPTMSGRLGVLVGVVFGRQTRVRDRERVLMDIAAAARCFLAAEGIEGREHAAREFLAQSIEKLEQLDVRFEATGLDIEGWSR